ncbi:SDR family oxidoreductase [Paraburkholderia kirstenboschensis]|uniref:SDR family oxidoreductase n=1 Tax=Paraburkholderia kirstenboschensis TaxID=1245436 RepID=UPI0037447BC7
MRTFATAGFRFCFIDQSVRLHGASIAARLIATEPMVKRGIRVNAVAPGPFWTPLQVSGGQTMDNLRKFGEDTPMGRPGQPAEIAPVYVTLAAAQGSYVTGQVYGASGGEGNP